MLREVVTPTVFTIVFMLFTGLYGFLKFSHQNDLATHGTVVTDPEGRLDIDPSTPTLAPNSDTGLEMYQHTSLPDPQHAFVDTTRPLITYTYVESPSTRENLMFFLDNGLHGGADFVFILNGPTDVAKLIPTKTNIQVVSRPNECFDLGAHGEVLRKDGLWKKYSHFITLNADIRGPFMPYWSPSCWSDAFLNQVTEDVKLVGITASCLPKFHIQPMIWATDSIGMKLLINSSEGSSAPDLRSNDQIAAFRGCYSDKEQAFDGEVEATAIVKQAGYKVDALMAAFHTSSDYEEDCVRDPVKDILRDEQYHGTNIHPYETLFVKANRGIDPITISRLTEWHQVSRYQRQLGCV